ncbi:MAG: PAS domain-containing protein [Archangium sp.]|nr:PAS domain-containing protein [Archangium sp.]
MDAVALLSVLDCLADGVAVVNVQHRFVYLNPAAVRLLGPLHLEGTPPVTFFRPDEVTKQDPTQMPLARGLAGEETTAFRVFMKRPDEQEGLHLTVTGAPWRNREGGLIGAVAVFSDVSALRRAELELTRAHAFLDSIVEHVAAMIFVKDAKELRFERFNRAGEELLGVSRAELLGKNDFDLFPREQAEAFTARDRQTLAGREVHDIPEEPIDTRSGRRWLSTRKVPVLDARGVAEYLLGISIDITARKQAEDDLRVAHEALEHRVAERTAQLQRTNDELQREITDRKRAEEALRRSEEQLRQSQKLEAIGRLAGGIAHDFNNMLSAMLGYAGLLSLAMPADAAGQQDVKQIVLAGERAAALIRQLLAFSRKQVLQPVVLDVGQVINGLSEMLRRLIGEQVELRVTTEGDCCVLADVTQIEQVLLNLSINARDAMPKGGHLTIAVANVLLPDARAAVSLPAGRYVRLSVSDDGVGMNEETKSRVFEPFFTTKPRGQGTGLGAATVFGIVKQSGGEVVLHSELGRGTTFELYLPHVVGVAPAQPVPLGVRRVAVGSATVLLVEDEPLVRAATARILNTAGFRVLEASTPDAALSLATRHPGGIDLLLTDVVLPEMNGRELAGRIGRQRTGVKVLFMSGYTDDAFSTTELVDPGAAFLAKPFSPERLLQRVDDVLRNK